MSQNKKIENTYKDSEGKIEPGMLSSPQIAYCVQRYGIIKNFDKKHLGPATYNMRVGNKVLTWEKGKKVEYTLGQEENRNKNIRTKVELRPNSLTFVTTVEKFCLPEDIIARFNLKSKWVHEGLLLGTGPIVDPELNARLLIPLHNFSSQEVTLNFDDEFISVEFTKTLDPSITYTDESVPKEDQGYEYSDSGTINYIGNEHKNFNFEKYRKRIGGKKVESSVSSKFDEYDQTIEQYKNKLTIFSWVGAITTLGTIVGLIVLFYNTVMLVDSANSKLEEANAIIKEYKGQNYDLRDFVLKSSHNDLEKKLKKLESHTDQTYADIKVKSDGIEDRIGDKMNSEYSQIRRELLEIKKQIEQLKGKED